MITIRDMMTDPALFGGQFDGDSWTAWRALLAGYYGLPLSEGELATWQALTARQSAPEQAADELWLVVGRRGGKSQAAALLCVYHACFIDHRPALSPGEVATVRVMATSRREARTVFRYVSGLLRSNPMFERLIVREDREQIELSNRVVIEIGAASFRSTRGYTYAAVIADELAFWRSDESANPDREILDACRPGLATLGGPLIALSSPYSKRGELWEHYKRYYGIEGSGILVAQAPSKLMNPSLPQSVIDRAQERDPVSAASEYGAEFRSDIAAFIQRATVESAARVDPLELPPGSSTTYHAFVDPAGGGQDEFCVAIGHTEGESTVVDVVRGMKGVPASIVEDFAALLKRYRVREAISDKYAGSWPADEFKRHGITIEQAAKPKSDLYKDALAAFNSGQVEIPPDDRLINQLCSLERRTARSGRDSIDHPPGGHDDRANVVAGLVAMRPAASDYTRAMFAAVADEPFRPISQRLLPYGVH